MKKISLQTPFFIVLFVAVLVLAFFMFLPFLTSLAVAASLAVVLWPLKIRFAKLFRGHDGLAALATAVTAFILILIPVVLIGFQIFRESAQLYQQFTSGNGLQLRELTSRIETPIKTYIPSFSIDIRPAAGSLFRWFVDHLGGIFAGTLQTALDFFVGIIAFFYFLRDGDRIRRRIIEISPLSDDDDEAILNRLAATISSVLRGTLLVSLIQGTLAGIGFAFFGLPNATLWGSLAALCALIPGFGTSLVMVPTVVYLILSGEFIPAFGLALWSAAAVGMIDNLLRPYLVGRGVKIHQLLILISVLGGIGIFGPLGFLIGPVVLSLLFALLDIYFSLTQPKKTLRV
jgi:predicted PurR-regulated permease PerM